MAPPTTKAHPEKVGYHGYLIDKIYVGVGKSH